jgi:hypothetical protein
LRIEQRQRGYIPTFLSELLGKDEDEVRIVRRRGRSFYIAAVIEGDGHGRQHVPQCLERR